MWLRRPRRAKHTRRSARATVWGGRGASAVPHAALRMNAKPTRAAPLSREPRPGEVWRFARWFSIHAEGRMSYSKNLGAITFAYSNARLIEV